MVDRLSENDGKVLELETRKKIYETVRVFAGSHFRELQRKSGLSTGSASYHLSYLVRHGLIKEIKEGNNSRYFISSSRPENHRLMMVLRQGSIRNIIICLLSNGDCSNEQISNYTKLSPSTVSWHLSKLGKDGFISSAKKGRFTFFSLNVKKSDVMDLLITYKESFLDALVDNVIDMWDLD